jgi:actin-related protein
LEGYFDTSQYLEDVVADGDYAYAAARYGGLYIFGDFTILFKEIMLNPFFLIFQIIDLTVKSDPFLFSIADTSFAQSVAIKDNYAYIGDSSQGIRIIDISNKNLPTLVSSLEWSTSIDVRDIRIVGNYLFTQDYYGYDNGIVVIDVTSKSSPQIVGYVESNTIGLYVSGNYIFSCYSGYGLAIYKFGDIKISGYVDEDLLCSNYTVEIKATDGSGSIITTFDILSSYPESCVDTLDENTEHDSEDDSAATLVAIGGTLGSITLIVVISVIAGFCVFCVILSLCCLLCFLLIGLAALLARGDDESVDLTFQTLRSSIKSKYLEKRQELTNWRQRKAEEKRQRKEEDRMLKDEVKRRKEEKRRKKEEEKRRKKEEKRRKKEEKRIKKEKEKRKKDEEERIKKEEEARIKKAVEEKKEIKEALEAIKQKEKDEAILRLKKRKPDQTKGFGTSKGKEINHRKLKPSQPLKDGNRTPVEFLPKQSTSNEVVVEVEEVEDCVFPLLDPYDLVAEKSHKCVSLGLTDELTRATEITVIPVNRLCPFCESLCSRSKDGCKHTKCGNPECGHWFCHVCLSVPKKATSRGCYFHEDESLVEWACGSGPGKAYTKCTIRNGRMVYPTQTKQNKKEWFVKKKNNQMECFTDSNYQSLLENDDDMFGIPITFPDRSDSVNTLIPKRRLCIFCESLCYRNGKTFSHFFIITIFTIFDFILLIIQELEEIIANTQW